MQIREALEKGITAHRDGRFRDADKYYTAILKADPNHPDANHNMGVLAVSIGKPEIALPFLEKALTQNRNVFQFWLSLIKAYISVEQFVDALELVRKAEHQNFDKTDLDQLQATVSSISSGTDLKQSFEGTEASVDKAINQAIDLSFTIELDEAEKAFTSVLQRDPTNQIAIEGVKFVSSRRLGEIKSYRSPDKKSVTKLLNLLDNKQYETARNEVDRLLKGFPYSSLLLTLSGVIHFEVKRLKDAVRSYERAIATEPRNADAHFNLGVVKQVEKDYRDAVLAYKSAIKIKPNYAMAHNNLGNIFQETGNNLAAIAAYKAALSLEPDWTHTLRNFGSALKNCMFTSWDPEVATFSCTLLDKRTLVRPKDVIKSLISLVKLEPRFRKILAEDLSVATFDYVISIIKHLSEFKLLLKMMAICPITDVEIEQLLQNLRAQILLKDQRLNSKYFLDFQTALALQCYTNEYVYSVAVKEGDQLDRLCLKLEKNINREQQLSFSDVLCLASYKALISFKWSEKLKNSSPLDAIVMRQIQEPSEELNIIKDLIRETAITDKTSVKVKKQYEENPYPRWVNVGLSSQPVEIKGLVKDLKIKLADDRILKVEAPSVLVAGCGTGQQSITTASKLPSSSISAIDLSLSSLAYAERKTRELGIENIKYSQCDILNVSKLKKEFHIIESSGVLHHMKDPLRGWKALANCLQPGGLFRIGLYSEIARKNIASTRKEIKTLKIGSSPDEMKRFRGMIIRSNFEKDKELLKSPDFFTLSSFRDLLFHVQEHRFTIPQIKKNISEVGLEFCGFENTKLVKHFKSEFPSIDSEYILDNWEVYENKYPKSFSGMYQFWCQKVY